jgi:hypothetical protein
MHLSSTSRIAEIDVKVNDLSTVAGVELVLAHIEYVFWGVEVVHVHEMDFSFSCAEFDIGICCSLLSRIGEIDEMPLGQVILIR